MSRPSRPETAPRAVTRELLRAWPLPAPDAAGDKRSRGMVVCVGGSHELPGAMVLAGAAALRAGAGTVRLGLPRGLGVAVGVAVPESLVFELPTLEDGGRAADGAAEVARRAAGADVVLVGPGVMGEAANAGALLSALLPVLDGPRLVVLDARALDGVRAAREAVRACRAQLVLTPHQGEMARLLDVERGDVDERPVEAARELAEQFQAVVALKGAETVVVSPGGDLLRYTEGDVGLATSGSGDTLAGIIAGVGARGADAVQATAWGVYLHGAAGNRLAQRLGRLGFLARELLDEVPPLLAELTA